MRRTLTDKLPSIVISLALAALVSAGTVYSHRRPGPDAGQVPPLTEIADLHMITGTPQELETVSYITPPAATVPAYPPPETAAPEYITEAENFESYPFIPLTADLQTSMQTACAQYEIAYDLILAVIKTESEFDAAAVGDSGNAYGLMQIQPRWWDWLAAQKGLNEYKTDPAQNAALGTAILSFLLTENAGDLDKALTAYNGGTDYPAKVYANYEWILEQKGARR